MSFALNFTQDINDISTMKQKPLKANKGMLVNTPQTRSFESDKMLAEAPPEDLLYRQFEGEPEEFTKENPVYKYDQNQMNQTIEPAKPMMDPQLQMILQAQNDMTGVNAIQNQKGLAALFNKTYVI